MEGFFYIFEPYFYSLKCRLEYLSWATENVHQVKLFFFSFLHIVNLSSISRTTYISPSPTISDSKYWENTGCDKLKKRISFMDIWQVNSLPEMFKGPGISSPDNYNNKTMCFNAVIWGMWCCLVTMVLRTRMVTLVVLKVHKDHTW